MAYAAKVARGSSADSDLHPLFDRDSTEVSQKARTQLEQIYRGEIAFLKELK